MLLSKKKQWKYAVSLYKNYFHWYSRDAPLEETYQQLQVNLRRFYRCFIHWISRKSNALHSCAQLIIVMGVIFDCANSDTHLINLFLPIIWIRSHIFDCFSIQCTASNGLHSFSASNPLIENKESFSDIDHSSWINVNTASGCINTVCFPWFSQYKRS